MQRCSAQAVGVVIAWFLVSPAVAIEPDERGSVATLPPVGAHWVWVPDVLLRHSVLFDGDSGEMMAAIDSGTTMSPKPPIYSADRGEFYSVEIDYARGSRGDRIDFVTIYDAETVTVIGEVVLPTKTSESASSIAYAELLDGQRFLATFNQFPLTSVSIVDLETRRFVGEIPTTGCAGIYPIGEQSFAMLCGNGTVMSVTLDAAGRKLDVSTSEPFFDVVTDPLMMTGGRLGERWIFVSFSGTAHEIDFSVAPPTVETWSLLEPGERESGWRPGGRQHLALHRESGSLYVIFHQGGPGSHKAPGPEVWRYDLGARVRVGRFAFPNFTAAFLEQSVGIEPEGVISWLLARLVPDEGADTITVSQDGAPLLFARSSQRGSIAVLDARTGTHLRNLTEAGLAGMRLETVK